MGTPRVWCMVVVALVAVAVAALAATGASSQLAAGLSDPVLRAAAVEIEAGSKRGAMVAADLAVTYLHGAAPSTDRLVLSGYHWLKSTEAGGYIGSFAPALGARIRCVSDFSDYVLWEISDPLPPDLQIPGASTDRRGRLYVFYPVLRPYFHEAYSDAGREGSG